MGRLRKRSPEVAHHRCRAHRRITGETSQEAIGIAAGEIGTAR